MFDSRTGTMDMLVSSVCGSFMMVIKTHLIVKQSSFRGSSSWSLDLPMNFSYPISGAWDPLKIKFSVWLINKRSIWTANQLLKWSLPHNPPCVFCNVRGEVRISNPIHEFCIRQNHLVLSVDLGRNVPATLISSSMKSWPLSGEKIMQRNTMNSFDYK
jgi:hypothetical protein